MNYYVVDVYALENFEKKRNQRLIDLTSKKKDNFPWWMEFLSEERE